MTSRMSKHEIDVARRANQILKQAIDIDEHARHAFVRDACADDDALLREVESLLDAHGNATGFLESSVSLNRVLDGDESHLLQPGDTVGRHRVVGAIGSGGMGTVYRAEQDQPRRAVAVKIMRPGVRSPELLRRFRDESEILAQLQHPHVAQVYEAGTYQSGRFALPYFVMEYVENALPVTEYARVKQCSLRERLALFVKVCMAVHHGHQKGIVHRDIKPPNVLVNGDGEPKIIDFGIARLQGDSSTSLAASQTRDGQLVGTLRYMSPEQCAGTPGQLDTRTDVYSLGVVLFELLSGRGPYDVEDLPVHEAVEVICEHPPVRPSSISAGLRGDIETIMLKALEKEIELRYGSAEALARDIERWLNDEPIEARPPSALYQVRMFTRRNRTMVSAAAVVALLLVGAAIVSTGLAIEARRERLASLWEAYAANITAANAALWAGESQRLQSRLDRAPARFRNWEWDYLQRNAQVSQTSLQHSGRLNSMAIRPDGSLLVSGTRSGILTRWDTATSTMIRAETVHAMGIEGLAFHPSGEFFASGSSDGTVIFHDAFGDAPAEVIHEGQHRVYAVAFSPDGAWLAWSTLSGEIHLLDVATREVRRVWDEHLGQQIRAIAFSPDSLWLASGSHDASVRVHSVESGIIEHHFNTHRDYVFAVAFSPDGKTLISGSRDRTMCVFDLEAGSHVGTISDHAGPVRSIDFNTDGSLIVSASDGRDIRVRRASDWNAVNTLPGHASAVSSVAFDHTGTWVWSASWDHTVRQWRSTVDWPFTGLRGHAEGVNVVDVDARGERLISGSRDGAVILWNVMLAAPIRTLGRHAERVYGVAFSVDETRVVSVGWDGARIWSLESDDDPIIIDDLPGQAWCVEMCPEGDSFAVGCNDGTVQIRSLDTGALLRAYHDHESRVLAITFSPDGARMLTGAIDDNILVYERFRDDPPRVISGHENDVFAIAFPRDGRLFASGSRDLTIRLWDADTLEPLRVMDGHGQFVTSVAFSPDGSRLVAGSWYGSAQIWDVATGEELLILPANEEPVRDVTFSPDGTRVVGACWDGLIRVWDSVPIQQREEERAQRLTPDRN